MLVPLASTGLRDIDIDLAIAVLKSGQLTMGSRVKEFEKTMANYLQCKNFIMVNSGSSANLLMIEALLRPTLSKPKLFPGDSILVPAIAWPTTIWPLIQLGLNPVFVDINPETLAIDLAQAQNLIDKSGIRIAGIFPIHPLGYAIPHEELNNFVKKNEIILISDVCESLGSWEKGVHAGMSSIAASFSFYFSHHITTMEGGGIATNDDGLADDLRSMRSHGWSRDRNDVAEWNKTKTSNDSKFLFVSTGYNVRPMEIQAAIGNSQIMSIDSFVERRRYIAKRVSETVSGTKLRVIGQAQLNEKEGASGHSWMLIPIQVTGPNAKETKESILKNLQALGVETRPVLTGNFLSQPAIQRITKHSSNPDNFPGANQITETTFLVGAHHDLTEAQIDHLEKSIIQSLE
jgi:CDP-6-deoxy-D-xylo-4-hexulose-3-dehydrase